MRQILFRAKTLNEGEWVEGMTIGHGTIARKKNNLYMEVAPNKWKGIDPESLGQFTGLYDANFKPIFEGDILAGINDHSKVWTCIVYYDVECAQYCGYRCSDDLSDIGTPEALTYFHITEWDKERKVWYLIDTVIAGNLWDIPEPKSFESSCLVVDSFPEFRKYYNH